MTSRRADGRTGGLLMALVAACASQSIRPSARPPVSFGPDSRVLISDFSEIDAVAASPWLVFAATSHGLLVYDRIARRFKPPVTVLEGYPRGRVRRAVADPSANAVWLDLGTAYGYTRYDVDGRAWTPGSIPSPQAERGALTVAEALAQAPLADALRAAILTDTRLRSRQFTSAAGTSDRPEIFFGTNGMGLVRVDKQTGEWEVLSYGLVAPGVGALAPASDGVWAAANAQGRERRRGLTWIASDLSSTRTAEGGGAALGFTFLYSRRLLTAGDQLWLATEQGVLRIDPSSFQSRLFDLPDATSLARAPDGGVWVGTTRGLSIITPDDRISSIGSRALAIVSLLAVGDTLWVGTSAGLGQLLPGANDVTMVPELADHPSAHVTVRALARLQDTIVMATEREIMSRDPVTRTWSALALPLSIGTPTALAVDPNGDGPLWVGGTHGLAEVEVPRSAIRVHSVPLEVPAAVRDVMIDGEYLWVATDSGLVRIR